MFPTDLTRFRNHLGSLGAIDRWDDANSASAGRARVAMAKRARAGKSVATRLHPVVKTALIHVFGPGTPGTQGLGHYNLPRFGNLGASQLASGTVGAASGAVQGSAVATVVVGVTSALGGAAAGAAAGSVVPIIGTAIGAIVGLVASGALNKKKDPEDANFQQASQMYLQNPLSVLNIADKYLVLAGLFDLTSSQIKGNIPIYKKYGRMGEQRFVTDMMTLIHDAAAQGKITPQDTPETVMTRIVQPWIDSWGYGQMVDSNAGMINMILMGMIAEYASDQQTSWLAVGGDYPFGNLPKLIVPGATTAPSGTSASVGTTAANAPVAVATGFPPPPSNYVAVSLTPATADQYRGTYHDANGNLYSYANGALNAIASASGPTVTPPALPSGYYAAGLTGPAGQPVYTNGQAFAMWTGTGFVAYTPATNNPSNAPSPVAGTGSASAPPGVSLTGTSTPTPSPNGASITPGSGGALNTAQGAWMFSSATDGAGNTALLLQTPGSQPVSTGGYGTTAGILNGQVVALHNDGSTWGWTGSQFTQLTPPTVTAQPPITTPNLNQVALPPVTNYVTQPVSVPDMTSQSVPVQGAPPAQVSTTAPVTAGISSIPGGWASIAIGVAILGFALARPGKSAGRSHR